MQIITGNADWFLVYNGMKWACFRKKFTCIHFEPTTRMIPSHAQICAREYMGHTQSYFCNKRIVLSRAGIFYVITSLNWKICIVHPSVIQIVSHRQISSRTVSSRSATIMIVLLTVNLVRLFPGCSPVPCHMKSSEDNQLGFWIQSGIWREAIEPY